MFHAQELSWSKKGVSMQEQLKNKLEQLRASLGKENTLDDETVRMLQDLDRDIQEVDADGSRRQVQYQRSRDGELVRETTSHA